ncbi:hypothetical protein [Mycobacterium sp.]|uniref:hypothetical protein n=1 Tax=Mycobacterium sp. TaxID=1785 RepID=UPI00334026D1
MLGGLAGDLDAHRDGRPRARRLGIVLPGEPGPLNALVVNDDMAGRDGHRAQRLPHARLSALPGHTT